MFMPPPQHLLSPKGKERLLLTRLTSSPRQPLPSFGTLFLFFLLHLISLSSPAPPTYSHWSIPAEEICPSAAEWVSSPGSFCTTLWTSPYLSNRTELEVRERRAVQLYCELDAILERFDCGQEYSVNVKRGQCQLCRQAYREWSCAVVADTTVGGSLDCDSKLMPCPSCASICHQVMRLCPYLSPDRMQYDLSGKSLPQVSQYGGHPAFYCPLENDDPSDPAYTSLCYKPFVEEDPDHVHNICTNPPKTRSSTSSTFTRTFSRKRESWVRNKRADYYDGFTSPSSSSYYNFGEDGDGLESSVTGWSSEFPLHYTTCCWTYASSLVIFDPAKDYPNYGSDAFFSTTLTFEEYGPWTKERHLEEKVLEKVNSSVTLNSRNKSAKSFKFNNVTSLGKSATKIKNSKGSKNGTFSTTKKPRATTTPLSTSSTTSTEVSSPGILPGDETNRVILNCCNSQGDCNAVDGEEEEKAVEKVGESESWKSQDIKSEGHPTKFIKNRKRSSERLGQGQDQGSDSGQDQDQDSGQGQDEERGDDLQLEEEEDDEAKLDGSGSLEPIKEELSPEELSPGMRTSSSSSSSSSATVLSLPSLFFKTIDLPVANPTHISELEDLEYDEHYLDTEPESSAASREEESEEDEVVMVEKVGEKVGANASSTPSPRTGGESSTSESESRRKSKSRSGRNLKEPFISVVIEASDSRDVDVDDHVLDREHHLIPNHYEVKVGSESRTKKSENIEESEDESFTFIDNTFNFGDGESSESDNPSIYKRTLAEEIYYSRQHTVPSSSPPQIGLSLLSPTYLISAVFMIRMWCLNSFVATSLLLLLTTLPRQLALVLGFSSTFFWICGSFLHKSNFRRTRTRSQSTRCRYKKSCVHQELEKVTDDDGSERNFCFVIKLSHLILSVAQPQLQKLSQLSLLGKRSICRIKRVKLLKPRFLSDDGYNCNYYKLSIYYAKIKYSAWVQSCGVSCTAMFPSLFAITQIQQQDFSRDTSKCRRCQDKRKEDNNYSSSTSSRSLSMLCRRKRRRKSGLDSESRERFKGIKIFRGFLPSSLDSKVNSYCSLCCLWLLQRRGGGRVVFNFKQFLNKFIFTADADNIKLDAPSKSLKSLLNLNNASILACRKGGRFKFKYKLKLLNLNNWYLTKSRISSNYNSTKIFSTRWKRKRKGFLPSRKKKVTPPKSGKFKDLVKVSNRGHNSFSQCCRTDKLLILKILVKITKISTTRRHLTPTNITITMIKRLIVIEEFISNNCDDYYFLFQKDLQLQTLLLCCQKNQNFRILKKTLQFFFKLKFCPILRRKSTLSWVSHPVLSAIYSNNCKIAPDLHLLSLWLSLAKRAAREKMFLLGQKISKLNSFQFIIVFLGLRGQSKSLIELCKMNMEPKNKSSFKVYARETLKLFVSGGHVQRESTIKIVAIQKSWKERCSSHKKSKTAAGFEIQPLIML